MIAQIKNKISLSGAGNLSDRKFVLSLQVTCRSKTECSSSRLEKFDLVTHITFAVFSFPLLRMEPLRVTPLNHTVIHHIPKSSGLYIGSPSITEFNGSLIVSHDDFGPKSDSQTTYIFCSKDSGISWKLLSIIKGCYWSTLFVHNNRLYIMGTSRQYGYAVIRESTDGGISWSTPINEKLGLISSTDNFHTAPVPVVEYMGRIWRCYEHRVPADGWAQNFRPIIFSAPLGCDLLDSSNWMLSNEIVFNSRWVNGTNGWLEGNLVVSREGNILDVLRVDQDLSHNGAIAYTVHLSKRSENGELTFNVSEDIINLPGGGVKFTIRYDEGSQLYWTLANVIDNKTREEYPQLILATKFRNLLVLQNSPDLQNWKQVVVVDYNEEPLFHGYQYADWVFSGDNILAVIRVADNDEEGGAEDFHNTNYLWFKKIKNFRCL